MNRIFRAAIPSISISHLSSMTPVTIAVSAIAARQAHPRVLRVDLAALHG
jgi:hypothetical protein